MDATELRADPLLRRPRLVRWLTDRPRISDALVIIACTVPSAAALILAPPPHAWLGFACVVGIAISFWWRRARPLLVLLVVAALAALNPLSWSSASVGLLECALALYALAASSRLRVTIVGYVLGEGVIFAASGVLIALGLREQWPTVLLQPASLVAIAIGVAIRAGRMRRIAIEQMVTMREDRATAAERSRIAAEMHDVVAHSVTVMVALAGGAAAGWEKHPERARHALDQLGVVGAAALEEMQRILRVLSERDQALESSGNDVPPLRELVDGFRVAGLPVELNVAATVPTTDPALQTTVYRIIQESLTNTLRHAQGVTFVEVDLAHQADQLIVTVTDNGHGSALTSGAGAGLGLLAMRERAAAFHGQFEAGPLPTSAAAPGTGWRTRISLPLQQTGTA